MLVDVILLKSVHSLGAVSDVVSVKMGYAKNFLIRMGYAVLANKNNLSEIEQNKKNLEKLDEKNITESKQFAASCDGISISLKKSSIQGGRLYGSVSAREISDELLKACKDVVENKDMLKFIQPSGVRVKKDIKYLGEYSASMILYGSISFTFNVIVESN